MKVDSDCRFWLRGSCNKGNRCPFKHDKKKKGKKSQNDKRKKGEGESKDDIPLCPYCKKGKHLEDDCYTKKRDLSQAHHAVESEEDTESDGDAHPAIESNEDFDFQENYLRTFFCHFI